MKKHSGFTIIELVIVIAIIAILASLVVPAYRESIAKAKRADAQGALLGLAQSMERSFSENNSYCDGGTTVVGGCGTGAGDSGAPTIFSATVPADGGEPYYNLTINANITATSYTLTATATGSMARDANCGNYTLNSVGQFNHTGSRPRDYCLQ